MRRGWVLQGAVQMGRINLARHRILADNLMGGGVGLPFILAVFKNNTVALPVPPPCTPSSHHAPADGSEMACAAGGQLDG